MGPADRARARARGWALVADLWARGLAEDTLAVWRALPGTEGHLPARFDADEAAAVWHQVVEAEVHPYESVYLGEEALLGGDRAEAARATRSGAGLGDPRALEADHLAEELRLLAFLGAAEADALADGVDPGHVHAHLRRALDEHLLRWLPALVAAVEGLDGGPGGGAGLYAFAAGRALDLAVDARSGLAGAPAGWSLPPVEDVLADPKAGLARIARQLAVPALAGGLFTQGAVRRIGRALDLPAGFGKRWQVIEGLLASAAHFDRVPETLAALDAEVARWDARYAGVAAAGLGPLVAPWRDRAAATRATLARIDAAAAAAVDAAAREAATEAAITAPG